MSDPAANLRAVTDCPGLTLPDNAESCEGCGYPACTECRTAHGMPGTYACRPCAESYPPGELAEVLESSAAYLAALARLREDPGLAELDGGEDRITPEECAESYATVTGSVDPARCEECGGPACTHCEAHLTAGPHAACEECGRRLIHVLIRT